MKNLLLIMPCRKALYLKEMHQRGFQPIKEWGAEGRSFEDAHNLVDADRKELNMAYALME